MNKFHKTLRALGAAGFKPTLTPQTKLLCFTTYFFGSRDSINLNEILGEYNWHVQHDGLRFLIFTTNTDLA
jgi:hypothetical protein